MGVTLALFEVIHYDALLEDAGLMGTVERALLHLAQALYLSTSLYVMQISVIE